jgi:hypothetical protein
MKTLSERIAERINTQKSQNRAVFLALRNEITQALADGWPMKTIWQTLHEEGKVLFGYDAFINHVKRLIKVEQPAQHPTPLPKAKVAKVAEVAPLHQPKTVKASVPGFTFNPSPNKDDLL